MAEDGVRLTDAQTEAPPRAASIAMALALGALVVLFYVVTIVKLGQNVADDSTDVTMDQQPQPDAPRSISASPPRSARVRRRHGRHVVRRRAALPHLLPGDRLRRHHPSAPDARRQKSLDRVVTVRFDANIGNGLGWSFRPLQREVKVKLGEVGHVSFLAENRTTGPRPARAAFNVAPLEAGAYFNKIACFCFTDQTLKPGEKAELGVTFFVDPAYRRRSRPRQHDDTSPCPTPSIPRRRRRSRSPRRMRQPGATRFDAGRRRKAAGTIMEQ